MINSAGIQILNFSVFLMFFKNSVLKTVAILFMIMSVGFCLLYRMKDDHVVNAIKGMFQHYDFCLLFIIIMPVFQITQTRMQKELSDAIEVSMGLKNNLEEIL